jgi:hypothetical protein
MRADKKKNLSSGEARNWLTQSRCCLVVGEGGGRSTDTNMGLCDLYLSTLSVIYPTVNYLFNLNIKFCYKFLTIKALKMLTKNLKFKLLLVLLLIYIWKI